MWFFSILTIMSSILTNFEDKFKLSNWITSYIQHEDIYYGHRTCLYLEYLQIF